MDRVPTPSSDQIGNRFLFVLVAAKRALQLQKGAKPRLDIGTRKPTVLGMAEVLEDKVEYQAPSELKPHQKRLTK
jgi:DNA-directed RNA polymerase subunit omega